MIGTTWIEAITKLRFAVREKKALVDQLVEADHALVEAKALIQDLAQAYQKALAKIKDLEAECGDARDKLRVYLAQQERERASDRQRDNARRN
jgi:hypothetical protein